VRRLGRPRPPVLVALLLAGNLAVLWWMRGDRVPGWDLFGATRGALALADGDVAEAFAIIWNGLSVVEALYWKPKRSWNLSVRLAPGIHELQILYHKYWHAGGMRFRSATAAGTPLAWRCDPDFGTMEAP
jgi:hypothetical protein